jgi:hypothetical protein
MPGGRNSGQDDQKRPENKSLPDEFMAEPGNTGAQWEYLFLGLLDTVQ